MNTVEFITSFYNHVYARSRGQAPARGNVHQYRTNKRKHSGASEKDDQASRRDDEPTLRSQAISNKIARFDLEGQVSDKVPLRCSKCGEVKSSDYFRDTTTHAGRHGQRCFDCWDDHVLERLDAAAALELSCMWCERILTAVDIQEVCRKAVFRKYERQASKETIEQTTQACPRCQEGIEKVEGCAHMECRCGHGFCWLCRVGWNGDPTYLGHLRGREMLEIARGYVEASGDTEGSEGTESGGNTESEREMGASGRSEWSDDNDDPFEP